MRKYLLALLLVLTAGSVSAQERLFEVANDAYQARNYDSALTVYQRIPERPGLCHADHGVIN